MREGRTPKHEMGGPPCPRDAGFLEGAGSRESSSAIWRLLGACWSDPPATHSHWRGLMGNQQPGLCPLRRPQG